MSDAALLKLRAQREQDKADAIVKERFGNALRSVVVTPENLRRLIERCNTSVPPTPATLDRMAHKLEWWITAGYFLGREIDSIMLINLMSNLSPDEIKMTDAKFASMWNFKDAAKRTQSRLSRGIVAPDEPAFRPCKSGKKCMRFEKRKPAPASGRASIAARHVLRLPVQGKNEPWPGCHQTPFSSEAQKSVNCMGSQRASEQ